jgi:alkaline phosphatase
MRNGRHSPTARAVLALGFVTGLPVAVACSDEMDDPPMRDVGGRPSDGDASDDDASDDDASDGDASHDASPPWMPPNVIVLLGDGMGSAHWEAARRYAGQPLAIDDMVGPAPYTTEAFGGVVTDSAASATAFATGRCTLNSRLGLSPDDEALETLLELAQRNGKQVGLVTNSYVIDASPMAFATHVPLRSAWPDIVEQLLTHTRPDLVLGGWIPPDQFDPQAPLEDVAASGGYTVAFNLAESQAASPESPLLGLYGRGPSSPAWPEWTWGMTPEALRDASNDEPTLEQMTRLALDRLGASPNGFFLFVESEHCDTIGHGSSADPVLAAALVPKVVLELDRAVRVALAWRDEHSSSETLVVVWSDHETGLYAPSTEDPTVGTFSTIDHSAIAVPAYAVGARSEALEKVRHVTDLHELVLGTIAEDDGGGGCP